MTSQRAGSGHDTLIIFIHTHLGPTLHLHLLMCNLTSIGTGLILCRHHPYIGLKLSPSTVVASFRSRITIYQSTSDSSERTVLVNGISRLRLPRAMFAFHPRSNLTLPNGPGLSQNTSAGT